MEVSDRELQAVEEDHSKNGGSETENYDSDDSEEDPTYDIIEETRSSFSRFSINKTKSRTVQKKMDLGSEDELDDAEIKVPELEEKDEKSFEKVQKLIQAGKLEKLKVEDCKVYLRKNGLRLTGKKDLLIQRIREHLEIMDGGGEKKYPLSSFVLNCKGDACTGDVVMFEQNVYEMYNIASRSATGPSIGTRTVVGRIVKESYGAAKQQHTFTIEVLWSKGVKPLPPLHPLLIKGRNLYKLKTMRQVWSNEEERRKILLEKHSRGSIARSKREARIQEKETRKKIREGQSIARKETGTIRSIQSREQQQQPHMGKVSPQEQPPKSDFIEVIQHQCAIPQSFTGIFQRQPQATPTEPMGLQSRHIRDQRTTNIPDIRNQQSKGFPIASRQHPHANEQPSERFHHRQPLASLNSYFPQRTLQRQGCLQLQPCWFYPQGRCRYGDRCKYLHD
ncbi:PREDICTED: zinc finger CCCH domain-containing protein 62-like [Nelumbo nucifera]|uniref:Zinc finger CCCH domain-containing protein 62-like n=2 Tax=Nelumbo nucifera TaxID=4432 RepID=A0A1U8BBJ1_NELNU|nr:PREDICTED: zinc finger CCCH domain-containing protein 62-like [Nelumbo nucifera]DAD49139.1 TPA_asm: hypothetical protein HUJ06_019076 [Nelumbo nucifera]